MLADLVNEGQLPPVEERLPENPSVYPVYEMVGTYGGTIRRGFKGMSDRWGPSKVRDAGLCHYNWDLTLRPDIIESWEHNEDASVWTLYLRKGLKWSDGYPFDASAFTWRYENVELNEELTLTTPANPFVVEAPDDYTVVVSHQDPAPLFMYFQNRGGQWGGAYEPGHYMKQFHLDLTDDKEALQKEVERQGVNSWVELYQFKRYWFNDINRPDVTPYLATNELSHELFVMERNPYFCAVDAEGQQLPYVDRITHRLFETAEVFNMWIVNGEIDWQQRHADIGNFTLYKENEQKGDFRVFLWKQDEGDVLSPNHDCKEPRVAEFFQNRDVRIALNVAIDRDTINELAHDGLGNGRQACPADASPEYSESCAQAYAFYDPAMANEYLDKAGYAERDAEGYRLWKDGSGEPVFFVIEGTAQTGDPSSDSIEMVVKYLADVGVKCAFRSIERSLFEEHYWANESQAVWWGGGQEHLSFLANGQYHIGEMTNKTWAGGWGIYYRNPDHPSAHRPPDGHFIWKMWEIWEQARIEPDEQRRTELFHQILDIFAEEVPAVGVIGELPGPVIVKNGLHNMVDGLLSSDRTANESLAGTPVLFWDEPELHG